MNKIGDEGVKSISESLKRNTSLTELHLGSDEMKKKKGKGEKKKKKHREQYWTRRS